MNETKNNSWRNGVKAILPDIIKFWRLSLKLWLSPKLHKTKNAISHDLRRVMKNCIAILAGNFQIFNMAYLDFPHIMYLSIEKINTGGAVTQTKISLKTKISTLCRLDNITHSPYRAILRYYVTAGSYGLSLVPWSILTPTVLVYSQL